MPERKQEYYHASRTELPIGTVLESRFKQYLFQWDVIESALSEPDRNAVLKSLLLADRFLGQGKSVLPFVLKEVILERIRRSEFSDRPGRMQCTFLTQRKTDMIAFRENICKGDDRPHLYKCSVDLSAPIFEADIHYVGTVNPLSQIGYQLDELAKRARLYWQGHQCDDPLLEILAPVGSVKVTATAKW